MLWYAIYTNSGVWSVDLRRLSVSTSSRHVNFFHCWLTHTMLRYCVLRSHPPFFLLWTVNWTPPLHWWYVISRVHLWCAFHLIDGLRTLKTSQKTQVWCHQLAWRSYTNRRQGKPTSSDTHIKLRASEKNFLCCRYVLLNLIFLFEYPRWLTYSRLSSYRAQDSHVLGREVLDQPGLSLEDVWHRNVETRVCESITYLNRTHVTIIRGTRTGY